MVQGGVPGEGLVVEWLNAQKEVRAVEASFSQERKLRTLRRVLKSEGKLWFIAPDRFRWEVGDPAKMVALQSGDGKVTVIEPRKKRAKVYDPANPEHAEMVQRLGLMKPGFGGGAEKFKEQFEVKKVSRAEGSDTWEAEMSFKDSRMALVVMKVVMRGERQDRSAGRIPPRVPGRDEDRLAVRRRGQGRGDRGRGVRLRPGGLRGGRLRLRPVEVSVEEVEGRFGVDGVWAIEPLDGGFVRDLKFCRVEVADFGEFVGDGLVRGDAVEVAALHHEWPRGDECGHLSVVEGRAEVPLEDFVFAGPDVGVAGAGRGVFPDPVVEIGRADREAVTGDERGDAHGGFTTVGKAVEGDAVRVDER